jgi:hypothetical protein
MQAGVAMTTIRPFTPDNLQSLPPNNILVFGSNKRGAHGKGAAKTALDRFGAIYGQAEGLQGQAYAIPTKDQFIRNRLPVVEIGKSVDRLLAFAASRPDLTFWVTEIGCGLAGYRPEDIAPLFRQSVKMANIILPKRFYEAIP